MIRCYNRGFFKSRFRSSSYFSLRHRETWIESQWLALWAHTYFSWVPTRGCDPRNMDETSRRPAELLVIRTTKRVPGTAQMHVTQTTSGYFVNTLSWTREEMELLSAASRVLREDTVHLLAEQKILLEEEWFKRVSFDSREEVAEQWACNACNESERTNDYILSLFFGINLRSICTIRSFEESRTVRKIKDSVRKNTINDCKRT